MPRARPALDLRHAARPDDAAAPTIRRAPARRARRRGRCSSRCSPRSRRRSASRCRSRRCRSPSSRWSCSSAPPCSGARLGMTSQLLYLALGLAGLPVFARVAAPAAGRGAPARPDRRLPDELSVRGLRRRLARRARLRSPLPHRGPRDGRRPRGRLRVRRRCGSRSSCGRRAASRRALAAGFAPFVVADVLKVCPRRRRDARPLVADRTARALIAAQPSSEHQQILKRRHGPRARCSCRPAAVAVRDHRSRDRRARRARVRARRRPW